MSNTDNKFLFIDILKILAIIVCIPLITKLFTRKIPIQYLLLIASLMIVLRYIDAYRHQRKLSGFNLIIAISCFILAIIVNFLHLL